MIFKEGMAITCKSSKGLRGFIYSTVLKDSCHCLFYCSAYYPNCKWEQLVSCKALNNLYTELTFGDLVYEI